MGYFLILILVSHLLSRFSMDSHGGGDGHMCSGLGVRLWRWCKLHTALGRRPIVLLRMDGAILVLGEATIDVFTLNFWTVGDDPRC